MRGFALALLLLATLAAAADKRFSKFVIDTNVLAVGETSHIQLYGVAQPITITLRPDGSPKELEMSEESGALPLHASTSLDENGILRVEVKAIKEFRGRLIIRDSEGRKADKEFHVGNAKLLRELRGPEAKK